MRYWLLTLPFLLIALPASATCDKPHPHPKKPTKTSPVISPPEVQRGTE